MVKLSSNHSVVYLFRCLFATPPFSVPKFLTCVPLPLARPLSFFLRSQLCSEVTFFLQEKKKRKSFKLNYSYHHLSHYPARSLSDFWSRKRPLYQRLHKDCPFEQFSPITTSQKVIKPKDSVCSIVATVKAYVAVFA